MLNEVKEIKEVIVKIKKECGVQTFNNNTLLMNIYYDYGVDLSERVGQLFKLFIDCEGFKEFLNVKDVQKDAQFVVLKLTEKMANKMFANKEVVKEFCQSIYCGLYELESFPKQEKKEEPKIKESVKEERKQPIQWNRKHLLAIPVVGVLIFFAVIFSYSNSYSNLVSSAKTSYDNSHFDAALKKYAKVLLKDEAQPEDYESFANSLAYYFINADSLDTKPVENIKVDSKTIAQEGLEKFPENQIIIEAQRTIDAAWKFHDTLVSASEMTDPSNADVEYHKVLDVIPEYTVAKSMKRINDFELAMHTEDWETVHSLHKNNPDLFEEDRYYINDQEVKKIQENQYGMNFYSESVYLGFIENGNFQGEGILYEGSEGDDPEYYITQGMWEQSEGNGLMTYIEKNQTTTAGKPFEKTYQGEVKNDLFDGEVYTSWYLNGQFGEGTITVENGKIIPIEETSIEGESEKCYHYIHLFNPNYSNWYRTESQLTDFGI